MTSITSSMEEISSLPMSPKVVSESEKMDLDRDLNSAATLLSSEHSNTFVGSGTSHQKNTSSIGYDSYPVRNSSHAKNAAQLNNRQAGGSKAYRSSYAKDSYKPGAFKRPPLGQKPPATD